MNETNLKDVLSYKLFLIQVLMSDESCRQMMALSPVIKKEGVDSPFSPHSQDHNSSPVERTFSSPAMSPTMSSTTSLHRASSDAMDFSVPPTDSNLTFHSTATSSNPHKTDYSLCGYTTQLEGGGSNSTSLHGSAPSTPTTPAAILGSSQHSHAAPNLHHQQRRKSEYDSGNSPDSPDMHFCSSTTQSTNDLNLSNRTEVSYFYNMVFQIERFLEISINDQ